MRLLPVASLVVVALAGVAACEPAQSDPQQAAGTVSISAFPPGGEIDCTAGCSFDLGDVALGSVRETPLRFTPEGNVVVTALQREGCANFNARPPGELRTLATTSIRLQAPADGEPGVCASSFAVIILGDDDGSVSIEVQATLVQREADTADTNDTPR